MSSTGKQVSELDFEGLLAREWLVANAIGGYASSTSCGLNSRRYHGLLVAAMTPPIRRMVLLSRVEETLRCDGQEYQLACNEYPDTIWPRGHELLRAFNTEPHPRWAFQGNGWTLQKELRLLRGQNTVVLSYTLLGGGCGVDLEVRPLLALRGMHELSYQWNGKLEARSGSRGHWHVPATRRTPEVFFAHDGTFDRRSHWYLNQIYRREAEYGYAGLEDLWSPGAADVRLTPGQTVHFACSADPLELTRAVEEADQQVRDADARSAPARARPARAAVATPSPDNPVPSVGDADLDALVRATELHLLASPAGEAYGAAAQYHWSPPSVRAALVGFAGLYLVPGRLDAARSLLTTLVGRLRNGLLPTDFPTDGSEPVVRGADVSLWFVNAVRQYLLYGGDDAAVDRPLLPACMSVIDAFRRGTSRGVAVDHDGLLRCGWADAAATWMDNGVNGQPATPRFGRPVEVNALWYNALLSTAEMCRRFDRPADAAVLESSAARARAAFNQRFWNAERDCCHDVVGDGGSDTAVRPNQLLAISLPFPVLSPDRWPAVVAKVRRELLTPVGLRTIEPLDLRYTGRYHGPIADRDRAAHNGSVYPWLLGPFVTAAVRAVGPSGVTAARAEARAALAACLAHLRGDGLGHLFELADGDAPHAPGGAIASPLSVAELLRCYAEDVLGRVPSPAPRAYPSMPPPHVPSSPDAVFPA